MRRLTASLRQFVVGASALVLGWMCGSAAFAAEPTAAAPPCPTGQTAAAGSCVPTTEAAAAIDRIVRDGMARHRLKAVLAGVSVDGRPLFVAAWGESMTGVPATPDMHFRNGAVAIAYIGTVLLQLHDKGVLNIDDTLSRWFPDYPRADRITLKMLINGTSGYPDYVPYQKFIDLFYADPFRQWTPDELVALALERPLPCEPGACWSYAHTNFVILGKVLEKASGRPLEDLIRKGILEPLSLKDTRSEATAIIQEPVLHAFDAERGKYEESTYWNPSWTLARGAIMTSNVPDILTSVAAIATGKLVSPASHALQLSPLTAKFPPWSATKFYGLGVFVVDGWIVQNPSFAGYAATMAYLPSRKLAIVVSTTTLDGAALDGNLSTEVLKEIAAYLAPEARL
jgi:CubicO group peptidase (beta-lactamase class C family)